MAHLLGTCAQTYFEPELFRMNINQFLQTSRTVTFIIQKHKAEIPDFDRWYSASIESPWRADPLMSWAKDSRNKIEKQGDLELYSSLATTLLFSYLSEEDIAVEFGRSDLVGANVKRLIRLAQQRLPTGVADAAAVKIERRWVATSLPDWELLHALDSIYEHVFEACKQLAQHLGRKLDAAILRPRRLAQARETARQVRYVKLRGLHTYGVESQLTPIDPDFVPPEAFASTVLGVKSGREAVSSLAEAIRLYGKMAKVSFEHFGSHVPIAFVLDSNWRTIDMMSTHFADSTDKYIFWRTVAQRLDAKKAHSVVWIAESWLREQIGPDVAIRNLPILGEQLNVIGFDRSGAIEQVAWTITRPFKDGPPSLREQPSESVFDPDWTPYFLVPAMRALGIPDRGLVAVPARRPPLLSRGEQAQT